MPLDQDVIDALLSRELERASRKVKSSTGSEPKVRPVQFGPLGWADKSSPCVSRNCRSPTFIRVNGAPKCSTHALYELNKLILELLEEVDLTLCTCEAGKYSKGNLHTDNCVLFPNAE